MRALGLLVVHRRPLQITCRLLSFIPVQTLTPADWNQWGMAQGRSQFCFKVYSAKIWPWKLVLGVIQSFILLRYVSPSIPKLATAYMNFGRGRMMLHTQSVIYSYIWVYIMYNFSVVYHFFMYCGRLSGFIKLAYINWFSIWMQSLGKLCTL